MIPPSATTPVDDDATGRKNMQQLIQLRWIAVLGQVGTILVVFFVFRIELPLLYMFAVLAGLVAALNTTEAGLTVAVTIRTDRYEVMQTHPALAEVDTVLFDELKPMPATQFKEVIVGPAMRATEAGTPLRVAPDLVERLLADAGAGADTLPMLALTMSRLYTDYGDDGELRLDQYEAMGGMARIWSFDEEDAESMTIPPTFGATDTPFAEWYRLWGEEVGALD